ncbi:MAG: radical SAM protein [Candidatus Omnitrophota bacterium]|nr:radical SAM protein [Candidatus Omnitrophota bacterium]
MKNKVILVNPAGSLINIQDYYKDKGKFSLNIGLLVVGTILKRQGLDVEVIDMAYDENYRELLIDSLEEGVSFVGCSVMTTQVPAALEISKIVKSVNPDIPVVWGGPHPTLFYEQTASHPLVDIAVVDEATKIIPDLALRLLRRESVEGINGIAFKQNGRISFMRNTDLDDIEQIGEFDHTFYDSQRYMRSPLFSPPLEREKVVAYPVLTGLGCCYSCKFCINFILRRKYRYKKATQIVKEIKKLQSDYGANAIWFMDEDFFINKKRAIELFQMIEKENLRFYWRSWVRIDHFKKDYLDLDMVKWLAKLGWLWSSMGAESGSTKTLGLIDKGITPQQTISSARFLSQAGPLHWARYTFIIGLPNESLNQMTKTFALAAKIKLLNPRTEITIAYFRPYPGSPLSEELAKSGNLNYPNELDEWKNVFTKEGFLNEENLSWISTPYQKKIKLLYFYFGMIKNYPDRKCSLLHKLLNRVCFLRLKYNILIFPVERYLFVFWMRIKPNLLKIKLIGDWYDKSWN